MCIFGRVYICEEEVCVCGWGGIGGGLKKFEKKCMRKMLQNIEGLSDTA